MTKWEIRYSVVEHGDEYRNAVKTSQYATVNCGGGIDEAVRALTQRINRTDITVESVRELVTDEKLW